ncbi:DUF3846 domain-containing protein [Collimonas humicola]|uniref:DUF3846 domain-containing protein n=1 Tax=Collimonas humicola TaxID=2825886 RepID=UPI001B8CD347|nr:hypothetical protein [Collimonas humicola]
MATFKAFLIDPKGRTVSAILLSDESQLEQFYKHIGCHDVDALTFPNGDTAWIDDEGPFVGGQDYFLLPDIHHDPIAGKCVVTGTVWDNKGDNLADCKTTVAELVASITWMDHIAIAA